VTRDRERDERPLDAKLRVVSGTWAGQTIQIPRGKLLIGRAEDCDVRPDSDFVSGYHCVLILDDYTLRIRDLGSKNGTFVNSRQVGTGTTILLHDDMIAIGEMNIIVDLKLGAATVKRADSETRPTAHPTDAPPAPLSGPSESGHVIPNIAPPTREES
jgi:pSer/pThr/pTyr-binding forkhead associated (FHA) protein